MERGNYTYRIVRAGFGRRASPAEFGPDDHIEDIYPMATTPPQRPDRIEPQSPPETPVRPDEPAPANPPDFEPPAPDFDEPDRSPEEYPSPDAFGVPVAR